MYDPILRQVEFEGYHLIVVRQAGPYDPRAQLGPRQRNSVSVWGNMKGRTDTPAWGTAGQARENGLTRCPSSTKPNPGEPAVVAFPVGDETVIDVVPWNNRCLSV